MRAQLLRATALIGIVLFPALSQADEFEIFDDAGGSSFEIMDQNRPTPMTPEGTHGPTPGPVETDPITESPISGNYDRPESGGMPSDDYWNQGAFACDAGCGPDAYPMPDLGCADCDENRAGLFFDAWIAQGYTYNANDPASGFNTPLTFNDFSNEYQMNQLYVSAGRAVNKCGACWDLGGRVDLLYGTDYFFTMANGLELRADGRPRWNSDDGDRVRDGFNFADYGLAMPQLYGEVFAPIASGTSIKFGRFYTPLGYENVQAPQNFFYSHSYAFQYGEPRTHTGVLADVALGPTFNLLAGYTRGWDVWEDPNGKPNYLMGFTWCPTNLASLAFAVSTGDEDVEGIDNRTVYSLVYTRRFGSMTYVLQHDFGSEANAEIDRNFQPDSAKWYGINQYFFMDVTPTSTVGMRVEWFRDQDNARVLGIPLESQVTGGNYVGLTLGMNWRPTCNLILRPEIRYDYSDVEPAPGGGIFDDFTADDQLTLAVDALFKF